MRQETYAALLRRGMRNKNFSRRLLEKALQGKGRGYSYEHIRRIVGGASVMSEQFNQDVCRVLGLDEEAMWQVALQEKAKASSKPNIFAALAPDASLKELWADLLPTDRERMIKIMEGIAEQRRAEREEQNTNDPESMRRRIHELTERLANRATTPTRRSARG